MSALSKIQWCDSTHNFWRGCTKVSAGCKNCYAEKLVTTRLKGEWGKGAPRVRSKDFEAPLEWNRQGLVCVDCGQPVRGNDCPCGQVGATGRLRRRRVFSLSLGDWLDLEVPSEWRGEMLDVIRRCPELDWLLLTKRPENWLHCLGAVNENCDGMTDESLCEWINAWAGDCPPPNVSLGVSVEDQAAAEERIPELLKSPAAKRFLSLEPLLGPVDLTRVAFPTGITEDVLRTEVKEEFKPILGKLHGIDWVIVGGESGPGARVCRVEWIRSVVHQCAAARVPVFVKQMGANVLSREDDFHAPMADVGATEIDWRVYFRKRKGDQPSEWPADLRIRQFPKFHSTAKLQNKPL